MIEEFSFSKTSGLSLSAVMSYVRPHLEAADEKVRMAAVEVIVLNITLTISLTQTLILTLIPTHSNANSL